jgi:flagellar motor switch protein FliN
MDLDKQIVAAFQSTWTEVAPNLLGTTTEISLSSEKQVSNDEIPGMLAVAVTWPSAYAAQCTDGLRGVFIFMLKSEDDAQLEGLIKQPVDGKPKPSGRALVNAILGGTITALSADLETPARVGESTYIDLTIEDSRLAAIVGNTASMFTFSLKIGEEINSQGLLIYAAEGSLESLNEEKTVEVEAEDVKPSPSNKSEATAAPAGKSRVPQIKTDNIERLLDVELDVVVRFGTTEMALRDVVRMGTGTMIELNRAVDEPVELLVNGRPLARGEVVVVDGYYGVRITEIGTQAERALSLS